MVAGRPGDMPRGKPHSDETRAAVLSALLAGQSLNAVAREYHISNATVISWRDAAGMATSPVQPEKRAELGDLIAEYLRDVLATLSIQARAVRDETWLKRQPASELAVLHGVLADKAIRILSALDVEPEPEREP